VGHAVTVAGEYRRGSGSVPKLPRSLRLPRRPMAAAVHTAAAAAVAYSKWLHLLLVVASSDFFVRMAAHHRDHHQPPSSASPPSPHRHHVDLQRAGQSKGGFDAGVEPEEDQDDNEVVEKLRVSLRELLQNCSMLAAFMCSLASAVYAQPPTVPLCYNSVKIAACIQWCAMGSFFLCICACIVLASDIDGVPNDSLAEHLRRTFAFHAVPQLTITAGIFLLSIG
jgi:hypothetical protein